MAYTTEAAVRAATGMTDATKISQTTVLLKIAMATNEIDSKIGSVYALPLANTPDMISLIALEIASALLNMDEYGEETQNLDKGWKNKLAQMIGMLDEIQAGTQKLYCNGTELTRSTLMLATFYPNAQSDDANSDPCTAPKFTMDRKF